MNVLEQRQAEAVVSIAKTLRTPDWEQRRYEIAKAAMVGRLASPIIEGVDPNPSMQDVCIGAVKFADALIAELKKGGEK
jgi:hypothetical protein